MIENSKSCPKSGYREAKVLPSVEFEPMTPDLHDWCPTNCATDAENFSEIHNIYTQLAGPCSNLPRCNY